MITLNFPSWDFIKSHPLHPVKGDFKEYSWSIFDIEHSPIYCRITYNEDDNGKLYLDMMVNGYSDHRVPDGFGKTYPATKKGYAELQETANMFVTKLLQGILESNVIYAGAWEEEEV